jgi:hypothetical protein
MREGTRRGIRGKVVRNAAIAALVVGPIVMSGCGIGGGVICEKDNPSCDAPGQNK